MSEPSVPNKYKAPILSLRTRYIKDFSFENPNAPKSLRIAQKDVSVEVITDVEMLNLGNFNYEVALRINCKTTYSNDVLFLVELLTAGVFLIQNFPKDRIESVCNIECPQIIFPFARQVIATITKDGGFKPLVLEPINFYEGFLKGKG